MNFYLLVNYLHDFAILTNFLKILNLSDKNTVAINFQYFEKNLVGTLQQKMKVFFLANTFINIIN